MTLSEWLHAKLADAEKALKAREDGVSVWKGGTDQSWKAVGCRLTRQQRIKQSEMEARIAVKCRRDVEMFKAVISKLSACKPS